MLHPAILPVVIGIISLLTGWLIGRAMQRKQSAVQLENALEEHRQNYEILQKEHTHKAQLMASMQHRQAELETRQAGFDTELAGWKEQLTGIQEQFDTTRRSYQLVHGEFQAYKAVTNTQLGDLSKINQGLEAHVQALHQDMQQRDARIAVLQNENEAQRSQLTVAHQRYEQYEGAATAQYADLKSAFAAQALQIEDRERRIADLERLRDQLKESQEEWEALWQTQNGRIADLERLRNQLQETNEEWETLCQQQNDRIGDLKRLRDQLQEGHEAWEESYQAQNARIADLERLRDQLHEGHEAWEESYQAQNARIADLERLRDQLQEGNNAWEETYQDQNEQISQLRQHIEGLENAMRESNKQHEMEIESAITDVETYKERIEHLLSVQHSNDVLIAHLEAEISRLRATGTSATPSPARSSLSEDRADAVLDSIRKRSNLLDFERIGSGGPDDADNLERLKGIGPFTARQLNALGLWNYRQLAALTDEDFAIINESLGFKAGRLKKWETLDT